MKKVQINDTFPGDSKGKIKLLDDLTASEIIRNGWGTEVTEPKAKEEKQARQTKEDKQATDLQTK